MMAHTLAGCEKAAEQSLRKYTDPARQFAITTYDRLDQPPVIDGQLTPADVSAANLLSLRLGWRQIIPLFADGNGPEQQLRSALEAALASLHQAPPFESHESVDDLEATLLPLREANTAAETVPKWTAVTVSKVLHRRLPHIVPLIDSRVREFYGVRRPRRVRSALWTDIRANQDWLRPLSAKFRTPDGRPLSLLRAADIIIWQHRKATDGG